MPRLEIQHRNGSVESVDLSTDTPLLIGSNLSSDVFLDAPGVASTHCRVQWTGKELEVQAATPAGVIVNGKTVTQGLLQHGGMLRIGDLNLVLLVTEPEEPEEKAPSKSIELKPTSADSHQQKNLYVPGAKGNAPAPRSPEARPLKPSPHAEEASEDTFDALYQEPEGDEPSKLEWLDDEIEEDHAAQEVHDDSRHHGSDDDGLSDVEEIEETDAAENVDEPPIMLPRRGGSARTRRAGTEVPSRTGQLPGAFKGPPGRRSQRDPLRSPMVMILGGTVGGLVLLAATIYFIVSRQQVEKEFKLAMEQHNVGNFASAIESLENFAATHPTHDKADEARVVAAKDRVNQPLAGTVPDWTKGLAHLNDYVKEFSNNPSFKDAESPLRLFVVETARQISLGSLETAKALKRRPLMEVSEEARRLYEAYLPDTDQSRAEHLKQIQSKRKLAEDAILQNEAFVAGAERFDAAFKAGKNLQALEEYRRLLFRYSDFATFRPLLDRLRKGLDKERELVVRTTLNKEALAKDRESPSTIPPLILAHRTRTRSDEASVGTTVFVIAADCAFGVDSVTGEPVWRRPIGIDSPFFPIRANTGVPSVLLFDTRYNELVLVEERSGKMLWRQPLDEPVLGTPLVVEGQIFASGRKGSLFQVDLNTGKLSTVLKFSQAITGGPVLSDSGERMYVAGNDAILYTLTRRPLGCDRANWIGHGPGAVSAPLLMMKSYLLMAENDRVDSCRLRLFDTSRDAQAPVEIASPRVEGHVRNTPILRGKQLFVPSDPERITAYTVAENGDASSLVKAAEHVVKDGRGGPMFLAAGPDDQFWATGTALRKFQLMRGNLRPDGPQKALGIAAQPLQMSGESLFVGRHPYDSRGVLLAEYERGNMNGQWQVSLGGRILEAAVPTPQSTSFVCVTSLGDTYQVTPERLSKGGFEIQAAFLPDIEDSIGAFSATRFGDGQLVVRGGKPPRLWFLAGDGSVSKQIKTPDVLQADPIQLASGIVLPLPGRLGLINKTSGAKAAEDLIITLGEGGASFRWISLVPMDDTQFIAQTDGGHLMRVQFRTGSPSSLAFVSQKKLERPTNLPLVVGGGRVVLTDDTPKLMVLDANDFAPQGEQTLSAPAAQAPWILGDRIFVDVGGQKLACYDAAAGIEKPLWELPLGGTSVGGAPLVYGDMLLVVLQDGKIWKIDPSNGKVQEEGAFDINERVTFGPRAIGNSLVIGTLNGSLYTLSSVMQKGK